MLNTFNYTSLNITEAEKQSNPVEAAGTENNPSQNDIAPSRLEFLGFEGWFSLNSYFARRKVKQIIDEIIADNP